MKNVNTTTITGTPVTVVCDSTTVRSCFSPTFDALLSWGWMNRSRTTWGSNAGTGLSRRLQLGSRLEFFHDTQCVPSRYPCVWAFGSPGGYSVIITITLFLIPITIR